MTMSVLQEYPWNLNLIENVKDTVVFLTRKLFFFLRVSSLLRSYKQEMHKSLSQRNRKWSINRLKEQKHWFIIHTWSDNAFNGTVENRTMSSLGVIWNYAYSPFKGRRVAYFPFLFIHRIILTTEQILILFFILEQYSIFRAGNFRMVDIGINAWSTLFLNLQIKYCLFSSWI